MRRMCMSFALLAAYIALVISHVKCARSASFTSIRDGKWSDPETWSRSASRAYALPGPGDDVFIASGTTVTRDTGVEDRPINSVSVQSGATLTCPRNVDLRSPTDEIGISVITMRIEAGGCLSCGYGDCKVDAEPFAARFLLRLSSVAPPRDADENVRTLLVENGGSLYLSGAPRVTPITRLTADAIAGQVHLEILQSYAHSSIDQPWRVGDRVAVAPTSTSPSQTEYTSIISIQSLDQNRSLFTISDPLRHARSGRVLTFVNRADGRREVAVDARAEVALLSRNVVIEGTNDILSGLGGDLMLSGENVRARLFWVEFRYLGRRGHLGRYPVHIHNIGNGGRNILLSNNAVHSNFQRGIVVHCTNGVTIINNTVAGSPGSAFILEDGAEEGNVFIGNYAIDVRPSEYPLIQTERINPAGFWFINAANTFRGNVAAGVAGPGFSLDMDPVLSMRPSRLTTCPDRLPGYIALRGGQDESELNKAVNTALMTKELVEFKDNVVHAAYSGLWMVYPFTPAFVKRTVPIARLTAWNLDRRPVSAWSVSTDGVSLIFDGCLRMHGQRGMHVWELTCVNAPTVSWASCVNTFSGTTVASVDMPEVPSPFPGALLTHSEPQIFLRTQLVGSGSSAVIARAAVGSPLSVFNVIDGLASDVGNAQVAASKRSRPLIQLNAGDLHIFTDASGDTFGAGKGATVSATYVNASDIDPLVSAYTSKGQCRAGAYGLSLTHDGSIVLPSGLIATVKGGLPVLCAGHLRFTTLTVQEVSSGELGQMTQARAHVDAGWSSDTDRTRRVLRRSVAFPTHLPINDASMQPILGGYTLRFMNIAEAKAIDISLSPTIRSSDGMTLHLVGVPLNAAIKYRGGMLKLGPQGTTHACEQLVAMCASFSDRGRPVACICRPENASGFILRMAPSSTPRYVGFADGAGNQLGVYDYGVVSLILNATVRA